MLERSVPLLLRSWLHMRLKYTSLEADFDDLDDLLVEADEPKPAPVRASSYAQSSAFVQAPIQRVGTAAQTAATNAAVREALSKENSLRLGMKLLVSLRMKTSLTSMRH